MSSQVIEDPVEIIDNERELKGFHNMDEVIKLVGYFKSEKSPRKLKIMTWRVRFKCITCKRNLFLLIFFLHPDFIEYDDAAEEFHPFVKFFATFDPKVSFFFFYLFVDLLSCAHTQKKIFKKVRGDKVILWASYPKIDLRLFKITYIYTKMFTFFWQVFKFNIKGHI